MPVPRSPRPSLGTPANPGSGGYPGSGGATEDPPSAVVVAETCSTSWSTSSNAPATSTGSSDNGLGFGEVRNAAGNGGSSSGTRYKIQQNPGASFSITCSPKVVFSGTAAAGPPIVGGNGVGSLSYSASAQPLEVTLSGGIGPKNGKRYLIGQHVGASLSTGGLTGGTFNWSVSNGDPFGNYTADQTIGHFTAAWPTTTNPTGFYFKTPVISSTSGLPIPVTVSCSAHLNVPAGALPAAGLDVAQNRACTAEPPSSATFSVLTGSVSLQPTPPSSPNIIRFGGKDDLPVTDRGIIWTGSVVTPPDFTVLGASGWNWVQLVTASRYRVNYGVAQHWVKNGLVCLDNTYPLRASSLHIPPRHSRELRC